MNKYNLIIPTEGSYYKEVDLKAVSGKLYGDMTNELFEKYPNIWLSRVEWVISKQQAEFKADLELEVLNTLEGMDIDLSDKDFDYNECFVTDLDSGEQGINPYLTYKELYFKDMKELYEFRASLLKDKSLFNSAKSYLTDTLIPCILNYELVGGYTKLDFETNYVWYDTTIDMGSVEGLAPYDLKGLFEHFIDVEGSNFTEEDKEFFNAVYGSVSIFQKEFLDKYSRGYNVSNFEVFNLVDYEFHIIEQYLKNLVCALNFRINLIDDFLNCELPLKLLDIAKEVGFSDLYNNYGKIMDLEQQKYKYYDSLDGRSTVKSKRRKLEKLISDFNKQFQ